MKWGISTYSLYGAMKSGRMDVFEAMKWMKEAGAEHVEIVPGLGFDIHEEGMPEKIRDTARELGLDISNYAAGGNFVAASSSYEEELEKAFRHVDAAARLGAERMRYDVASRPPAEATIDQFEADLAVIVKACRDIADYAAARGIVMSIENHGYHVQSSDRVLRILHEVGHPKFGLTVDIGNFMCADENSVAAVKKTIAHATMLHLKDFYLRPASRPPGEGWFTTVSGNYLRGAIFGQGDIDAYEVLRVIRSSGYDGYVSIEFEGMEDCLRGTQIALDNARRIWETVGQP